MADEPRKRMIARIEASREERMFILSGQLVRFAKTDCLCVVGLNPCLLWLALHVRGRVGVEGHRKTHMAKVAASFSIFNCSKGVCIKG